MYGKCKKCGEQYADTYSKFSKWCKPCQLNSFKTNGNGNEKIDSLIQDMQLKIKNSQNPDTKDYIIVLYQDIHYSGNKIIDRLIQEMQLKINSKNDIVFEWIPYNQFDNIIEIDKGGFATVCSAVWRDGPMHCCDNF